MSVNPFKIQNTVGNEAAVTVLQALQTENVKQVTSASLSCPYLLKEEEFDYLSNAFGVPIILQTKSKRPPQMHPHGGAAYLNLYAYEECSRIANSGSRRAIDIGGTPLRTDKNHHICALVSDTRSDARYSDASFTQLGSALRGHDWTNYLTTKQSLCLKGAQHCNYRADYAYMINVYDISMEDIARIFAAHRLHILDAWMFMPYCLIDDNLVDDQVLYTCMISRTTKHGFWRLGAPRTVNATVKFHLNDSSNIYEHDYDIWRSYYTTTKIVCDNFSIAVEHKKQFGTFTNIRFVRCDERTGKIERVIPLSKRINKCRFPNLVHYQENRFASCPYTSHFIMPSYFITRMIDYGTSMKDESFNFQNFATYAKASMNTIKFSTNTSVNVVYEGLQLDCEESQELIQSMFLYCAIARTRRTKVIGKTFSFLKTYGNEADLSTRLRQFFVELDNKLWDVSERNSVGFNKWNSPNYIMNIRIKGIEDVYFSDVVHFDVKINKPILVPYGTHIVGPHITPPCAPLIDLRDDDIDTTVRAADPLPTQSAAANLQQFVAADKTLGQSLTYPVPSWIPSCNWTNTYNPPGDGYCGKHVLLHQFKSFKVSSGLNGVPGNWMSDDDVATDCYANQCNLFYHVDGKLYKRHDYGFNRNIKINLQGGHYYAGECNCTNLTHMVGNYNTMQLTKHGYSTKHLYVNCANDRLTDGAGQAKTFADMFPTYKTFAKIPAPPVQFLVVNGVHLCIAVAHNNKTDNDHDKTHQVYKQIFDGINNYCTKNDLTVLMPAIGTALFGTSTRCFRQHFDCLTCKKIMCHYTSDGIRVFNESPPCGYTKHTPQVIGGYFALTAPSTDFSVIMTDENNRDVLDSLRNETKQDKMENKFADILKYLQDNRQTLGMRAARGIYDACVAPGDFYRSRYKFSVQYKCAHYVGPNSFELSKGVAPNYTYATAHEHVNIHSNRSFDYIDVLFDTFLPDSDLETYTDFFAKFTDLSFTFKTSYERADQFNLISRLCRTHRITMQVWRNEASDIKSSELYITFFTLQVVDDALKIEDFSKPVLVVPKTEGIIATGTIYNKSNNIVASKSKVSSCHCTFKLESICNGEYAATPRQDDVNRFVSKLNDQNKTSYVAPNASEVKLPVWNGVGGARKTRAVVTRSCNVCTLIVEPYRESTNDLVEQGANAITFVRALKLLQTNTFRNIVLDEIFAWPIAHIHLLLSMSRDAVVIGLGDDKQIDCRGYDAQATNYSYRGGYTTITYRMPKKIVSMLSKYIPGLVTKSTVEGVVQFNVEKPSDDDVIIVNTQDSKKVYKNTYPKHRVVTSNEAQGCTFRNAFYVTSDIQKLPHDKIRYVYVAVSRVTHILHVSGPECDIMNILNSPIENAMDLNGVTPHDTILASTDLLAEPVHYEPTMFNALPTNFAVVEDILDKCYRRSNDVDDAVGFVSAILPDKLNNENMKLSLDMILPKDVTVVGKKLMPKSYQPLYHPKCKKQIVDCMITRYAKQGKSVPSSMVDKYVKAFMSWLIPDALRHMRKLVTQDRIYASVMSYIRDLQKKFSGYNDLTDDMISYINGVTSGSNRGLINRDEYERALQAEVDDRTAKLFRKIVRNIMDGKHSQLLDLEVEFYENYHRVISFHLKRQPKEIRQPGFDELYKAGQGISAWSKLLNIIYSAFTRTWSELIPDFVRNNVQLSYGKSDAEISLEFIKYGDFINDPNYKQIACDFSEFDSSQEKQCIISSAVILKMAGFSEQLMDDYVKIREQWALMTNDEVGKAVLQGRWQQHSGQPFTLDGNTMFNMTAIGVCLSFKDMKFAAFKGDDMYVIARDYKHNLIGEKNIADLCGYKLKLESPRICEYIANIVTPHGFFPDVLRRVGRIVSKIYTTQDDWAEIRKSTNDSIDVVLNDANLLAGCDIASMYYNQYGIDLTAKDVEHLLRFLQHVSTLKSIDDFPLHNWNIVTVYNNSN